MTVVKPSQFENTLDAQALAVKAEEIARKRLLDHGYMDPRLIAFDDPIEALDAYKAYDETVANMRQTIIRSYVKTKTQQKDAAIAARPIEPTWAERAYA